MIILTKQIENFIRIVDLARIDEDGQKIAIVSQNSFSITFFDGIFEKKIKYANA